ncbi:MAG: mismatch repair protein MutL [Planctomycetota bacterium]|jgi:DNA mismatch repair protein MutL
MPIRLLPPELVNQIAAGEVVERPASVVKELVENALDAGARRILVEIEGGGVELIRISDDGSGIPADELPLAVAAHATSKVRTSEDLAAIGTFGFRGEALASIASVSRFRLASCPKGADAGAEIEVEGGAIRGPRPAPARPGTVVEVRTLFFNVPARRKFLKSDGTESSRIVEAIEAVALAHPHVAFELRSNGRKLLDLAATDEPARRTLDVLGKELEPELLEFEERFPELGGLVVRGFAGKPSIARPSSRAIRIHLNGRPIADRTVLHAVREAYRGLVDPSRTPTVALILELDPHEVDVNVHPQKSEVRFRSQGAIHSAVRKAVEHTLRAANLVPHFTPDAFRSSGDPTPARAPLFGSGLASGAGRPHAGGVATAGFAPTTDFTRFAGLAGEAIARADSIGSETEAPAGALASEGPPRHDDEVLGAEFPYIQLLGGFIVTEDADGIVIVDQHALHERAMFAMFMARLERGALESQRLLVPIVLEPGARAVELLGEISPLLARLGIEARAFGPRSVAVDAVPTLLHSRNADAGAFIAELLDKAVECGSLVSLESALHEIVDMMSCKAAVKAGDSLAAPEIRDLLRMRESVERSTACPHGRPTSIRIARHELERRFGRT